MTPPLPHQIKIINDTVMDGFSTSSVNKTEQGVHFRGEVSLANNGGFASMRGQWSPFNEEKIREAQTFQIVVKGDGHRYQLRLYTHDNDDGSAYVYGFDTIDGQTMTIKVPLSEFKARYRGRPIKKPPLKLNQVIEFGLLIGEQQAGVFNLILKELSLSD